MEKENILIQFGQKVQRLRNEKGLSQEQLAEIAHVHRTYIGMIERAEKKHNLVKHRKNSQSTKGKYKGFV